MFTASFTEPGIIPKMTVLPGEYIADPKASYFAEYKTLSELHEQFSTDGITEEEAKFYNKKKFKY